MESEFYLLIGNRLSTNNLLHILKTGKEKQTSCRQMTTLLHVFKAKKINSS